MFDLFGSKRIKLLEKMLQEERNRSSEILNRLLQKNDVPPILEKEFMKDELDKLKVAVFAEVDENGKEVHVHEDGSVN